MINVNKAVLFASLILFSPFMRAETIEHIQQTGEIELCANPDQMPFSRQADRPEGFQIDIAQALADKLGVSLNISWIRYRHEAKRTQCDFYAGVAKLGDRESKYMLLTDPFMHMDTVLVTRENISQGAPGMDDLKPLVVGVSSGSMAAHALVQQGVEIAVRFKDEASRLQALADGVIDAAVVSKVSAGWFNQQTKNSLQVYDAEPILGITLNYDYALGLRRSDDASRQAINDLLLTMKQDGTLAGIFAEYGLN